MLFARALVMFILGVGCQVAGVLEPKYAIPLVGAATLLLSFGDLKRVIGWSPAASWMHWAMFLLGVAAQVLAIAFSKAAIPLQGAATVLLGAVDLKRFVTPDPPAPSPPAGPPAPAAA